MHDPSKIFWLDSVLVIRPEAVFSERLDDFLERGDFKLWTFELVANDGLDLAPVQ